MLPNTQAGIEYWQTQPANLDGVLGGYGSGVRTCLFTLVCLLTSAPVTSQD